MFTLDDQGRVTEPESKTLEYKRDLSSPAGPLRTIVAFANSAGGQLVIGVDDDRGVIGVDDPLAEEERLANLIADSIAPRLVPTVEIVTLADRAVLIVEVTVSGRRPHHVIRDGEENGTYVRLGSTNRQADTALIAELRRGADGRFFDREPAVGQTVADLDTEALARLLGREVGESDLRTLELITDDQGEVVPTNGGVLLIGHHREQAFPMAWVQMARFQGEQRLDFLDQAEFHGHLPDAVDEITAFLTKHAYRMADLSETRRRDVLSIPLESLREIVVNALIHASYETHGVNFKVAFLDDRIEVESPGLLLPGMTVNDLVAGGSRVRNPVIARLFRETGYVEQWGTGIPRVIRDLEQRGLGAPTFDEVGMRLRVTIPIPLHRPSVEGPTGAASWAQRDAGGAVDDRDQQGHGVSKSRGQVSKLSEQDVSMSEHDDSLSHQVESLSQQDVTMMRCVTDQPATRAELLQAIGLRNETRNYRRHVAPLLEAGLLEWTVPDRPRSRLQQYRMTDRGRAALRRAGEAV